MLTYTLIKIALYHKNITDYKNYLQTPVMLIKGACSHSAVMVVHGSHVFNAR